MCQPECRGSDGGSAVAIAEVKAGKKQFFSRSHLNQVIAVQRRLRLRMVEATKRSERPAVRSSAKGSSNTVNFIYKNTLSLASRLANFVKAASMKANKQQDALRRSENVCTTCN